MLLKSLTVRSSHVCIKFFSAIFIFITAILFMMPVQAQDLDVPFVPTPQDVVDRMLEIANVRPGDYVIDLGSGDGRIVISAVQRGARGHGVDLDPQRIEEARENAEEAGISDRVMFLQEDLFKTDFSRASVITMYLLSSVNEKLRPRLLEELEPGTRVVSHSFDMGDWEPDKYVEVESGSFNSTHSIYFWVIPARAEGDWNWNVGGQPFSLSVEQQYQEVTLDLSSGNQSLQTSEPVLRGRRIGFRAEDGNTSYIFSGRIEGDSIAGYVQIDDEDNSRVAGWEATRN